MTPTPPPPRASSTFWADVCWRCRVVCWARSASKHCNKPKPPHVELGLKKRSEAGPPPKVKGRGRDEIKKAGTGCDEVVVRRI